MARFIYIVILTTYMYFAKLTIVTYGDCSAGEVQKHVSCSSLRGERSHCPVEGIGTISIATIFFDRHCLKQSYGTYKTGVWTANGCSGLFEIFGEAITTVTVTSEIPKPSHTSIVQLTSTSATMLDTHVTDISQSDTMATSTADSMTTYETTQDAMNNGTVQLTTTTSTSTPKQAVENNATIMSKTTKSTSTEQSRLTTSPVSTTPPDVASISFSSPKNNNNLQRQAIITTYGSDFNATTTNDLSTPVIIPMSTSTAANSILTGTTAYGTDLLSTPDFINMSTSNLTLTTTTYGTDLLSTPDIMPMSTSTAANPILTGTTAYGTDLLSTPDFINISTSNMTLTTTAYGTDLLYTPDIIPMSTSTAANPLSTGTKSYGTDLPVDATSSTTASAPTSTIATLSSPKHHITVASPMNSKTSLNQNITKTPTTCTSRQENAANTFSASFIAGIIAGSLLSILTCVAFVYILKSRHPYNSVTPSTDV